MGGFIRGGPVSYSQPINDLISCSVAENHVDSYVYMHGESRVKST